ncbi:hypothetical protein O7606_04190 [Micromonospora sp. WMMD882]|uniref:hypothetical protein n=1 Tax=Micromonospora sp. WMMD882 TaxID=3015151 RepID=UPI00248AD28B|nr:hypothetical protein [Micromonospora sp. WMMD882]WBB80597.1 hypothetical protein O7606_04190 [Micromonospora sp. WMMD882]
MTTDPRYAALGLASTGWPTEGDEGRESGGEIVGADDAAADAARAGGADVDLSGATRDGAGVPVGADDADADRERAARQSD